MMRRALLPARPAAGFSMIEVMVALLVIAIALFGTAKIQALTINATHNSASRSIAALQAASLAASMRANEAYWTSLSAPPPAAVASYNTSTGVTTLDTSLAGLTANCASVSCTPAAMAAYDLNAWVASLTSALPAGGATVACAVASSAVPETCTVTVQWTEKSVAANALTLSGANPVTLSYSLVVQP